MADLTSLVTEAESAQGRSQSGVECVQTDLATARIEARAAPAEAVEEGRAHARELGRREETGNEAGRLRTELATTQGRVRIREATTQVSRTGVGTA